MTTETLLPLWIHQKEGIDQVAVKRKTKFCFFFDTGTGKTRTAIEIYNLVQHVAKKAVIIAPLNVCRNWQVETSSYCKNKVPVFIVSGGIKAKKLKAIADFQKENGPAFLCINTESFQSKDYTIELTKQRFDFLVIDEAHDFKTHDSNRTKELLRVIKYVNPKFLFLLTGTPAPQGEIDLWTPLTLMGKISDPFFVWRLKYFQDENSESNTYLKKLHKMLSEKMVTNLDFENWRKDLLSRARHQPSPLKATWQYLYDNKLCVTPYFSWFGDMMDRLKSRPIWKIKPESKTLFNSWLADCSMYVKKEEAIDLPPFVKTSVYFEMPPATRNTYDSLMKGFRDEIKNGCAASQVNAHNTLSKMAALQQLTAGIMESQILDTKRLTALKAAIETCGESQFIVWTVYIITYKQISDLLTEMGISHALLVGSVSAEDRFKAQKEFQEGKIRALIGHPKAGGVGVNLTAAAFSIHYTKNYNLVNDMQSEARNYRGGSERHSLITRIDILAEKSIDEQIDRALQQKKNLQELIMSLENTEEI